MARIRTIKPEFWTDDLIGSLSRDARLLFIGSWNMADDEGLLRWSAPALKGAIFPFDDDVSVADVQRLMDALVDAGIMFAYNGGRSQQKLAYIVNFHRHQRINRPSPSKLPPPSLQDREAREMYARRDGGKCHLCHGIIDESPKEVPVIGGWSDDFCLSLDHLTPASNGGTDMPSNIRASHQTCNKGRRNRTVEQYQELLRQGSTLAQRSHPDRFTQWLSESSLNEIMTGSRPASSTEEEKEGKGKEQGDGKEQTGVPPEFDSFFAVFPKQEQADNARKEYLAALGRGATVAELQSGAERFAAHVAREKIPLRFVPLAKTWLADGCWKDRYGTEEPEAVLPPLDPSWPASQVKRWSKNIGEVNFRTYFGPAEYIDVDPVILKYRSSQLRRLAEEHFPRVAQEVALEVAA